MTKSPEELASENSPARTRLMLALGFLMLMSAILSQLFAQIPDSVFFSQSQFESLQAARSVAISDFARSLQSPEGTEAAEASLSELERRIHELKEARESRSKLIAWSLLGGLIAGALFAFCYFLFQIFHIGSQVKVIEEQRETICEYIDPPVGSPDWVSKAAVIVAAAEDEGGKRGDVDDDWVTEFDKMSMGRPKRPKLAATEEGMIEFAKANRKAAEEWLAGKLSNDELKERYHEINEHYLYLCYESTINSAAFDRVERMELLVEQAKEARSRLSAAMRVVKKMQVYEKPDTGDLEQRRDLFNRVMRGESLDELWFHPRPGSIFDS